MKVNPQSALQGVLACRVRLGLGLIALAGPIGCQAPSQASGQAGGEALRVSTVALPVVAANPWTSFDTEAREQYAGATLGDGSVLVCGGINTRAASAPNVTTCDRLSFDTTLHSLSFQLPEERVAATLTLLPPDRVLLAGGVGSLNHALTVRLSLPFASWSVNSNIWGMPEGTSDSPAARVDHTATLLDTSVVLVGGEAGVHQVAAIDVRSPDGTWTNVGSATRTGHTATVLKSQPGAAARVLILGGYDSAQGGYLSSGFIFSLPNTTTPIQDMPEPRRAHTATLLDDGSVLVVGGEGPTQPYLATAWRYSPSRDIWTSAGSTVPRKYHAAARLGGDVIVAGGQSEGGPTGGGATLGGSEDASVNPSSVQRYEPVANAWSTAANMHQGRYDFQLLPLDATHLLAVGGANDFGTLATSELFTASALGQISTDPNSCVSGHVADGVCCDSDCAAACHWCNDPTAPGTCQSVSGATPNQNGCPNHLQCSAGTCGEQCDASSPCEAGFFCASGVCQATRTIGVACGVDAECAGGRPCVDGVCCESLCSGSCEACDQPDRPGLCRPLPEGDAPKKGHPSCPFAKDAACAASCDGHTVDRCVFAASGAPCAAAVCSDTGFQPERSCDGSGTCEAAPVKNCAPYGCAQGGCLDSCEKDMECVGDTHCSDGRCARCDELECNSHGYRCDPERDECRQTCEKSETDCAGGYYCHPLQHRCVEAVAFPAGELPSCAIGHEPAKSRHSMLALASLACACAVATRRKRRASRPRAP